MSDGLGEGGKIEIRVVLVFDIVMGHVGVSESVDGDIVGQTDFLADLMVCLVGAGVTTRLCADAGTTIADEEISSLLNEMEEALQAAGIEDTAFGEKEFFRELSELLFGSLASCSGFFLLMLGASLALTLGAFLCDGSSGKGELHGGVNHTLLVAFLSACAVMLYPQINEALDAVRSVSTFCESVLPVFLGVNLLSGMEQSAALTASAFGILLAVVEELTEKIALPALALLLSSSLVPSPAGDVLSLNSRLYKLYLSMLGILSTIIASAFALQNVLVLNKDRALLRALRYGVGSMIPIVGQTVAGTLSALSGGVVYAKSAVGVSVLLAIFALALPPLLRLLACRLTLSLPSLIVGAFGEGADGTLARLYQTVRRLLDATLALVALTVSLFVFVVILFMKSTVSFA